MLSLYDAVIVGGGPAGLSAALATADREGRPAVRFVLIKRFDVRGFVVFTHLGSRKAREMLENSRAALCFHWASTGEQVRIEGAVEAVAADEADAYFGERPRGSQIGAWASLQSEPLADPAQFQQRIDEASARFGDGTVPRPPHWGGYRLCCDGVELWTEGAGRFHERVRYFRTLTFAAEGEPSGGAWQRERLQP